jgi:hypothetical protein
MHFIVYEVPDDGRMTKTCSTVVLQYTCITIYWKTKVAIDEYNKAISLVIDNSPHLLNGIRMFSLPLTPNKAEVLGF